MQFRGRPVNADAALEQEADRLGSLISRYGPAPEASATIRPAPLVAEAPVQRQVTSFDYWTEDEDLPPVPDLIEQLEHDHFTQSEKAINTKIRASMLDPKTGPTPMPSRIEATIMKNGKSDKPPTRRTQAA